MNKNRVEVQSLQKLLGEMNKVLDFERRNSLILDVDGRYSLEKMEREPIGIHRRKEFSIRWDEDGFNLNTEKEINDVDFYAWYNHEVASFLIDCIESMTYPAHWEISLERRIRKWEASIC